VNAPAVITHYTKTKVLDDGIVVLSVSGDAMTVVGKRTGSVYF
jgi:hypothetical protein